MLVGIRGQLYSASFFLPLFMGPRGQTLASRLVQHLFLPAEPAYSAHAVLVYLTLILPPLLFPWFHGCSSSVSRLLVCVWDVRMLLSINWAGLLSHAKLNYRAPNLLIGLPASPVLQREDKHPTDQSIQALGPQLNTSLPSFLKKYFFSFKDFVY